MWPEGTGSRGPLDHRLFEGPPEGSEFSVRPEPRSQHSGPGNGSEEALGKAGGKGQDVGTSRGLRRGSQAAWGDRGHPLRMGVTKVVGGHGPLPWGKLNAGQIGKRGDQAQGLRSGEGTGVRRCGQVSALNLRPWESADGLEALGWGKAGKKGTALKCQGKDRLRNIRAVQLEVALSLKTFGNAG